jgi:hypothetical protein
MRCEGVKPWRRPDSDITTLHPWGCRVAGFCKIESLAVIERPGEQAGQGVRHRSIELSFLSGVSTGRLALGLVAESLTKWVPEKLRLSQPPRHLGLPYRILSFA